MHPGWIRNAGNDVLTELDVLLAIVGGPAALVVLFSLIKIQRAGRRATGQEAGNLLATAISLGLVSALLVVSSLILKFAIALIPDLLAATLVGITACGLVLFGTIWLLNRTD